MSDYNCYIIDDEADAIEIIQDYINQTPNLRLIYSSTNPRDIFTVITESGAPKITFLDIEMPGISGLELAGLISGHTAIVFITSHTQHALEAFEKDAYDYLVKPVSYKRFLQAVIKVQSRIQHNTLTKLVDDNSFFIKGSIQGELIKIKIDEILYIESLQNYVRISTVGDMNVTYLTLKECEFKLDHNKFLQVHKSYVVNLDRIVKHINNQLTMENKKMVPIGSKYRSELLARLKNRIFTSERRKRGD